MNSKDRQKVVIDWIEDNQTIASQFDSPELLKALQRDGLYKISSGMTDVMRGYKNYYARWLRIK